MANMDYCKFQNTEMDLEQCLEALENDNLKELSQERKFQQWD